MGDYTYANLWLEGGSSQKDKVDIKVGNAFDLDTEGTWTDGAAMRGEYVYLGKYRARRYDGATVRLPRWWRKQATRALVAA